MVYLAKDNMKNMKFRGGLNFAREAYPYTGGDTGWSDWTHFESKNREENSTSRWSTAFRK